MLNEPWKPLISPTLLSGVNFALHAAGWLEGGLCSSYEKFVMDSDQLGMMQVIAQGIDLSEAAQAIKEGFITSEELVTACQANFQGHERLRASHQAIGVEITSNNRVTMNASFRVSRMAVRFASLNITGFSCAMVTTGNRSP